MTLWLKVTHDEYELPVAVADNSSQLAILLGIKRNSIFSSMYSNKRYGWWTQFRKVEIDEED